MDQGGQHTLLRRRGLALQDKIDVTSQWKGEDILEKGHSVGNTEGQGEAQWGRVYGKTGDRIWSERAIHPAPSLLGDREHSLSYFTDG